MFSRFRLLGYALVDEVLVEYVFALLNVLLWIFDLSSCSAKAFFVSIYIYIMTKLSNLPSRSAKAFFESMLVTVLVALFVETGYTDHDCLIGGMHQQSTFEIIFVFWTACFFSVALNLLDLSRLDASCAGILHTSSPRSACSSYCLMTLDVAKPTNSWCFFA